MSDPRPTAENDRGKWADPCPACGAAAGVPCSVPLSGIDTTGWSHDARIMLPVYRDLACVLPPGMGVE